MACLESNFQVIQPQGSKSDYGGSVVTYNFSVSDPTVWVPSKSFFRCQMTITADAGRPTIARCLTLAENAVGNSIQNCSFEAGGVTVSKISTGAAQIGALKMRRGASRAWLNSVGASVAGWGGTFSERLVSICGGSNPVGLLGASDTYVESIFRAGAVPEAEVAIATASGICTVSDGTIVVTGDTALKVGTTFVHSSVKYTVTVVTNTTTFTVTPHPAADIAANIDWYFVQRDTANSPQGKHIIEVMWQPPLGIMDPSTPPLGGGSFKFELTPFSDYQNRMAEALSHVAWSDGTDWNIDMKAPDLYLYTAKHSYGNSEIPFPLREFQSYSRATVATTLTNVLQLTVPRSTTKIHMFLQASTAGTNTTTPMSRFTDAARNDLNMTSVQVTYAGQTKFKTPWASSFAAASTNRLTAMYFASLVENDKDADEVNVITAKGNNSLSVAPTSGGQETMLEWFNRGPIWTLAFNRSASGSEVDATVDINFSAMTTNSILFIVAEYDRLCTIRSQANQIVDVSVVTN